MRVPPLLAALRHHKTGVVLIALQIALTLAIVCNALFIIARRIEHMEQPTGIDEQGLFLIRQNWVHAPSRDTAAGAAKLDALLREDLATLRGLPDVAGAAPTNSLPLTNYGQYLTVDVKPNPGRAKAAAGAAIYSSDQAFVPTLGLQLVAGRNFKAGDVMPNEDKKPAVVIVTQALADKLFPQGNALGKPVYIFFGTEPSTIIGIVRRLEIPAFTFANSIRLNSLIWPARGGSSFSSYVVRAKPGRLRAAMRAARAALYKANPLRVIDDKTGIWTFARIRARAYRADRGMAIVMGLICFILLGVTAAGVVGLTSFWVGQRRKQIGVRRALGARKRDVLRYFHAENLLIAGAGSVVGIALAIGFNLWLITHYEMQRLPVTYVLAGAVIVIGLGQAAVAVPARRAANVPPVVATRSV